MRLIDAQFLETPWYGSRQMARLLRRDGYEVGRKRMRRLMTMMGLAPIYQRPRTTMPHPEHRIYPTCCGSWWWTVRTRSGVRISRKSQSGGAFCISSRLWTGRRARCWPGGCPIQWTWRSASRRCRRLWPGSDVRRFSISTRAANLYSTIQLVVATLIWLIAGARQAPQQASSSQGFCEAWC